MTVVAVHYGVEIGGATTAAIFIYMRRGALVLNKYLSERCSAAGRLSVENERKFNEMHPPNTHPHWNGKFGGIMRCVEKDIDKLMQRILHENTKRMCVSRERASKTTIPLFEMYGNLFKREKVVIPM
jgi:hypothetical protein